MGCVALLSLLNMQCKGVHEVYEYEGCTYGNCDCSQDIRAWQNSESQFSMCKEEGFSDAIVYQTGGKGFAEAA